MPKQSQAKNTRQMFIDNFFNNTQVEAPSKIAGSDCSATKQTCATFFSGPHLSGDHKNPHFYNSDSAQLKECERLNLKISKLKSRSKHPQANILKVKAQKECVQNRMLHEFNLNRRCEFLNLNVHEAQFKQCISKENEKPGEFWVSANTNVCSNPNEQFCVDKKLKQSLDLNTGLISSAEQNDFSSKMVQETQNVAAFKGEIDFKREPTAVYHNKLIDFIKQHQYVAPANVQKAKIIANSKVCETPFEANRPNLKAKNFHIFNENKVLDYQLNATYRVSKMLGKGSFAEVRLANRISDDKLVAIKSFRNNTQSPQQTSRVIQNEIKILKSIDHPNIVKLLDIVVSNDFTHLVLDYCDGLNLYEYMHNRGAKPVSESLARRIFVQLLNAVNYLHLNNIYHRDLKLDNIMIDRSGKVTIIDFGFAIQVNNTTKITSFCGTPFYMAPEIYQMMSYQGHSVDIWALAVILFKLTVGEFPFKKTSTDQTPKTSIIEVNFTVPSQLSKGLLEIFKKVFVKNADSRISMSELLQLQWLYCERN